MSARMRLVERWSAPLFIALVTAVAFAPTLQNGFVNWDDDANFLNNSQYRGLGWRQLAWMFTTFHMSLYRPVTWMTFGMDYLLWGMEPFGYHLTSLLFHIGNALLLYQTCRRLIGLASKCDNRSGGISLAVSAGFGALVFAVHPLRVEAVAWLSARNDLVSGFFYLATIRFYLEYAVARQPGTSRMEWLGAALAAYSISLLAKGIGLTLPAVLLILDFYPLRRLSTGWRFGPQAQAIWREKVPFLVLAVIAASLALFAKQESKVLWNLEDHSGAQRAAQTIVGLAFYLWKTAFPTALSPLYELRPIELARWQFATSAIAVISAGACLWLVRKRWPSAVAAALCYATIVAPVLGIAQFGSQLTADRYSYLGCLPWAVLAGGSLHALFLRRSRHWVGNPIFTVGTGIALCIVGSLSVLTWVQARVWHDTERLWRHAVTLDPESSIARNQLGNALADRGALEEAIEQYRQALRVRPAYAGAHYNLAMVLSDRGDLAGALRHYEAAVRFDPANANAHNNLGVILVQGGDFDAAIEHYRQALQIRPDFPEARDNLRRALAIRSGRNR